MSTSRSLRRFGPGLVMALLLPGCGADGGNLEPPPSVPPPGDTMAPELRVLAPLADMSETRRLLRLSIRDETGIATASYALNGGAKVMLSPSGKKQLEVAEALPLRPGKNTIDLQTQDTLGNQRAVQLAFHYGLTTTAGGAHSGAVVNGRLLTWGRHNVGQLGLGEPVGDDQSRLSPEPVADFGAPGSPSTVASIAFNQNHSLAVRSDGTVFTWGANGDGQLGLGDTTPQSRPTQVAGLADAVYGALGYSHTLLLRADGTVMAWGRNGAGQLGVPGSGSGMDREVAPVAVRGLPADIVKIVAGAEHSVALSAAGAVYTWGRNDHGNLGLGTVDTEAHPQPSRVPGLSDVIDIASGRDHLLALRADGTVVAWGLGGSGQLGYGKNADPSGENRTAPVTVLRDVAQPLTDVQALFANGNTSYALRRDGQYWGFGQNFNGQLAIGLSSSEEWFAVRAAIHTPGEKPKFLDEVVKFAAIGAGITHTILQTGDGKFYGWGWNFRGSLGVPTLQNAWAQTAPMLIALPQ